jgi:hypothetical protein
MDEQLTTNSPISDFENVVNAEDIENPAPELNLPTEGQFQPIESFLAPSVADQQNEQQVQQQQSNVDELLSSIQSSFGNLATQGATQVQMENQAGIGTMSTELTNVENEIRQKSLAFRRQQEAIQTEVGLTQAQRNARLGDVSRRNNMELADLEVIRQARSNSLTNAQSLIDKKIELQFGDERRRLEGLQFIYSENKDKLSQKQNELLQSKIKKEERAFELAKGKYQTLEQEKLQLVRNAQANGAGNGVMSSILKSQSLEEAYRNAGSYGMSLDDRIKKLKLNELFASAEKNSTLSAKELKAIADSPQGKAAVEGIAVNRLLAEYQKKVESFGKTPSRKQMNDANAFLLEVLGPKLSVALGQGGMTQDEIQNKINNLGVKQGGRRESVTLNNINSVKSAVNSIVGTNIDTVNSFVPGASEGFEIFRAYERENATPEERVQMERQDIVTAFQSDGIPDDEIIEYLTQTDTANADLIQYLNSQGYSLQEIMDNL